jgi:hypothetical protein
VDEMAKATLEIGETEKHRLVVNWSLFWKHITIELDGKKVVDKFHYSPLPEKFQFDVGSSEQHRVEISAGGFSPIKLFVDGKEAQET